MTTPVIHPRWLALGRRHALAELAKRANLDKAAARDAKAFIRKATPFSLALYHRALEASSQSLAPLWETDAERAVMRDYSELGAACACWIVEGMVKAHMVAGELGMPTAYV